MWSWLPALVAAIFAVVKGVFGLDRPQQVTTDEKPSPLPAPADADVLHDLGIGEPGRISAGAGFSGGAFPTVPIRADDGLSAAVADGLHAGTDGGNPLRDRASGPAAPGDGERDGLG